MEIVKYLCEFFFTNFWHWLGLLILIFVLRGEGPFIGKFNQTNIKNENIMEKDKKE